MKKSALLFFLLFQFIHQLSAQWEAMEIGVFHSWGPNTKVDALGDEGGIVFYGVGVSYDSLGQGKYLGFLFSTYDQGIAKNRVLFNNPILSVVEYQGDTIITGAFENVHTVDSFPLIEANIEKVLVLNNESMQPLGSFNGTCRARVIGDDLYIFGYFSEAMGDSCNVIKWDGGQWEPIGPPLLASHHDIRDITFYNGELYIAGNIIMNNGLHDILVLRDGEWQEVGETIPAGIASFNKLVVYNGELYAAGGIRKLDGFAGNMIQRWNGEIWQEVGNSLYSTSPSLFAQVKDMKVYEGYLYVSGAFYTAGWEDGVDTPGIARWDGSQWCGLYTQGAVGQINSFAYTDGELYVRQQYEGIPAGNPAFVHRYLMGDEVFPCSEVFTGLDDEADVVFSLLPNPCTDHFYLEFQSETNEPRNLAIYSITGQRVKSQPLSGGQRHTIDVSDLEAGMYVVQLMENGQPARTSKMVVQDW